MATEIKITISDTDFKVFKHACTDPESWVEGAVAAKLINVKKRILNILVQHCNENSVALAVGEEAQILQAFDLELVKEATSTPSSGPE